MLGNVWEKKAITIYVRPQRYTKEFLDVSGRFTAMFFEGHQKELLYLGTHSGREVPDKITRSGLHLDRIDGQPAFVEGKLVLTCRILFSQQMKPEGFLDKELMEECYPDNDYSYCYVAEIESAYEILGRR